MVYKRSLTPPRQSFFLFGPRGSGKTTWVRQNFPQAHTIDLLDEALYQSLLASPGLFHAEIASRKEEWICVDEVQRLPALLNEVHRSIENEKRKFVLTGSSARKLKSGGVNLLAGRALKRQLYPFLPDELGKAFDLEKVLRFGSLPLVWEAAEKREVLAAYVQMYLKEEIQAAAIVRNLGGFARFLPIAALCHAQVLNVSSLARDAETSRTTVSGYVDILEDTLLAFRLPGFESKLRVRERKNPKLYWIDPGIVRAVKKQLGPPTAEERGALFEGYIAMMLKAHSDYRELFDEWSYWAPQEARKTEVDFLLQRGGEFLAIEVKAGKKYQAEATKGLRAIADLPKLRRRILVYGGEKRLSVDGIDVLPFAEFAKALALEKLWP